MKSIEDALLENNKQKKLLKMGGTFFSLMGGTFLALGNVFQARAQQ